MSAISVDVTIVYVAVGLLMALLMTTVMMFLAGQGMWKFLLGKWTGGTFVGFITEDNRVIFKKAEQKNTDMLEVEYHKSTMLVPATKILRVEGRLVVFILDNFTFPLIMELPKKVDILVRVAEVFDVKSKATDTKKGEIPPQYNLGALVDELSRKINEHLSRFKDIDMEIKNTKEKIQNLYDDYVLGVNSTSDETEKQRLMTEYNKNNEPHIKKLNALIDEREEISTKFMKYVEITKDGQGVSFGKLRQILWELTDLTATMVATTLEYTKGAALTQSMGFFKGNDLIKWLPWFVVGCVMIFIGYMILNSGGQCDSYKQLASNCMQLLGNSSPVLVGK